MKSKFIKSNWYGFDHEQVNKRFEGGLEFLNTFCINYEYYPVAVYKCKTPDKKKGHKKYVLLQIDNKKIIVRGLTPQQMKKQRYQQGVKCLNCDSIVFSPMRHQEVSCPCKNISVDGGKDYLKYSGSQQVQIVQIDLLTGTVIKTKEEKFHSKLKKAIND